jgi:electron transfer flavoprotein alpha subunit
VSVLCLAELDGAGAVSDVSLRALALARDLAGGQPLAAVVFGPAGGLPLAELGAAGAASVYAVPPGGGYAPRAWARALAGLAVTAGAAAVLAGATDRGNEVLAYLGALTGQPMAANCLAIAAAPGGGYRLTRQRWAGLLLEDAELDGAPALATVSPDVPVPVPAPPAPGATPAVHEYQPELTEDDLRVRATVSAGRSDGASLATARVVVGGGRGVGGPEGFAPLEELAGLLGGVVGVSRVVTSQGWRPHTQQVGQTGTKITPELYLACGISGAIQHMAGCASARHIVAVNTDPAAPIMSRAGYAVIGDLAEVIPALVAALRERG